MKIQDSIENDYSKNPERILQFGQGNFLRAFADWIIDLGNEKGKINSSVVVVKATPRGDISKFKNQNNKYTILMRGLENSNIKEDIRVITSISRVINPYEEYNNYLEFIKTKDLRYVISNTTEAGIKYKYLKSSSDYPETFPAKVTKLLYTRYKYFKGDKNSGLIFFPVELIDNNGDELKRIVLKHSLDWHLEEDFINWVNECNVFTNTLVDRIVTGYPKENIEEIEKKLGYEDELLVTSELYNLWVIEEKGKIRKEFPIEENGANVIWTKDVESYKKKKVRILNGAHTSLSLAGYLSGIKNVRDMVLDSTFNKMYDSIINDEVIPAMDMDKDNLVEYSCVIKDRFLNPYINHKLIDISLNSISKFKARCMPSILDYYNINKILPSKLVFSLAVLLRFYKIKSHNGIFVGEDSSGEEYEVRDELSILEFFESSWKNNNLESMIEDILSNKTIWGMNLNEIPKLKIVTYKYLNNIMELGVKESMKILLGENNENFTD